MARADPPLSANKTFKERIRHQYGRSKAIAAQMNILEADLTIHAYEQRIAARPGNDGILPTTTKTHIRGALLNFALYADLEITPIAFKTLIDFKKAYPNDTTIEQTLQQFASEPPIKASANRGTIILGLFRANFAPLQLRINTHYPPTEENCTEGTFLQIFHAQSEETRDMLRYGQYVPERAKAAYRVLLSDIDLSRKDYAIVWIQAQRSKTRTKHPCFVPIHLMKRIVQQAQQAGRNCPFPNHESLWKQLTKFAKDEYNVRLVSNYLRKRYVDIAETTTMPRTQAAFIMGDKTKMKQDEIHLSAIYGRGLRFVETLIDNFASSGLARALEILPQTTKVAQPHASELLNRITNLEE